ncbi:TetR family transcriptional regulator [Pseudomonas sp. KNUC1026]|uniref:TetR family transcriptional regulator n=1 Tax=Pseudomonas sp. KNUC1026 TaxID=2893890 RepID=UPI001F3CDC2C|nr:TetR family transcriptional regulator [Pseudomonas sp. KNUC1026]UFH50891.1 TetR family transcriptional regulator [Pseudomonas sp. KNUC1026]
MPDLPAPPIASRKQPQQARSAELVKAVLQAAIQVLASEGATRFTVARVAERAGVSVGSVYQYFPNKAAILFRLQSDEWRQTCDMLCAILEDRRMAPRQRVEAMVRAFVQSECEEAQMRGALDDAAPLYRHAPEAKAARDGAEQALAAFIAEVAPAADACERSARAGLIATTMSAVGKRASSAPMADQEREAWMKGLAAMLWAAAVSS